ncbi:hypothetical protein E3P94_00972 [Wallemia ichthyophaga]|nr:hypothetical protein E3P98_00614 [Wallemia ichthyophaga]TIB02646.1 hypothetical protein E3P95_00840 [Wallemia ichthyophaga]TIB03633.1 hypothetical protein E3P94_00972 [Wallemia ichthyophaga]
MICPHCASVGEYDDSARAYICSSSECAAVLGVYLDEGYVGGRGAVDAAQPTRKQTHPPVSADHVQHALQSICTRIPAPHLLAPALHVWQQASTRVYTRTPAAAFFLCACVLLGASTTNTHHSPAYSFSLPRILMAANIQPDAETVRRTVRTVRRIKRALNYQAGVDVCASVSAALDGLFAQAQRMREKGVETQFQDEQQLHTLDLRSVHNLARDLLTLASHTNYLDNRRRGRPVAVAMATLAIESHSSVSMGAGVGSSGRRQLIALLSRCANSDSAAPSLSISVSHRAVANATRELLSLLRKIARMHIPILEQAICELKRKRSASSSGDHGTHTQNQKHRYTSLAWVGNVVQYALTHLDTQSLAHTFTPDLRRNKPSSSFNSAANTSNTPFAAAAVAFVRDRQPAVISVDASRRLIADIERVLGPAHAHPTRTRFTDKVSDDISDSELFSDEELASYLHSQNEVAAKQVVVGDRYDLTQSQMQSQTQSHEQKRKKRPVDDVNTDANVQTRSTKATKATDITSTHIKPADIPDGMSMSEEFEDIIDDV